MYGHDQTRAFCHITDAVEGTVLAIESDKSNGEIFHIGTEEEITIEQLIKTTGSFFNYDGTYKEAQTFPGSTNRRCPDISKARNLLGYNPRFKWQESLESTLEWYEDFFQKVKQPLKPHLKIQPMYSLTKRMLDISTAFIALILLTPLFIPIILILRFTGEGEVFYFQERVGLDNKTIKIFKFATMLKNSEKIGTGIYTAKNDPRILPFGNFLRKTKINELPQIINILIGDIKPSWTKTTN